MVFAGLNRLDVGALLSTIADGVVDERSIKSQSPRCRRTSFYDGFKPNQRGVHVSVLVSIASMSAHFFLHDYVIRYRVIDPRDVSIASMSAHFFLRYSGMDSVE